MVPAKPPPTRAADLVETIHGVAVPDPYRWLEDANDPEVRAWVAAQTAHARARLDRLPGRHALAARLRECTDCGALGRFEPRGRRRFFIRRDAGMDQAVLLVAEEGAGTRVLLDPRRFGGSFVSVDWWEPSPDGELVCIGLSEAGSEAAVLRILRTANGHLLADRIPNCRWSSVAFEPGQAAFLYTRHPWPGSVPPGEEVYHRHVWRHVIGSDPDQDVRVFGEGRDKRDFAIAVSMSSDGRWTVVTVQRGTDRNAVFLREGAGGFRAVFDGPAARMVARFAGRRLLARTNFEAPNYRVVEIDPERPDRDGWRDLVPESEHLLEGYAAGGFLAVHHLVDASSRVSLHRLDGTFERVLELPPFTAVSNLGAHPGSEDLTVTVQSFTRPPRALARGGDEFESLSPPAGFDPDRHPVRRVRYRSKDGVEVPMFLVGRAGGSGPVVLTGYGGFGLSLGPTWEPALVPFLEAGGLYAVANLRGGGEFGTAWHQTGRLGGRQRVFDDFIAAAQWLVASGLTTAAQLGILGHSNGGLLVGAAITQRPELFGAAVCRVPLFDMVRYDRFKLGQMWTAEYGSPAQPEQFGWLVAYSPYHRVRDGVRYPPLLVTTGEEDARVDPMHARKMVARLQAADPGGVALLRAEPRAGHGPGKPAAELLAEHADVWSFLLGVLAIPAPEVDC